MSEIHIGIDATRVGSRRRGIDNFTYHLLANLPSALEELPNAIVTAYVSASAQSMLRAQLPSSYRLRLSPVRDGHPVVREQLLLPSRIARDGIRFDIFHSPGYPAPLWAPAKRRVITVHDVVFRSHPETMTKDRWYWRLFFPGIANRADLILTDSSFSAAELWHYYPRTRARPLKVLPMGIGENFVNASTFGYEADRIRARHHLPPDYIVWIGAIQPRKNLPFMIEVLAHFYRRYPKWSGLKLVLVGAKAWKYQTILSAVAERGLGSNVMFLGHIDDHDLVPVLSGARAFVFPSLHEGFGIPVLEAMACGVPVLAARAGALPEVVGDAGLLLPLGDAHPWIAALNLILGDPTTAESMRLKGLERSKRYTWRLCAQRVVQTYIELLAAAGKTNDREPN